MHNEKCQELRIPYEVALPPNFELANIRKRKTNWICSLALFSAAINYFNGLRWKVLEGTGVSIAELALDFEMSQSVLPSPKSCPLPSAWQDKTSIFLARICKLTLILGKQVHPGELKNPTTVKTVI